MIFILFPHSLLLYLSLFSFSPIFCHLIRDTLVELVRVARQVSSLSLSSFSFSANCISLSPSLPPSPLLLSHLESY